MALNCKNGCGGCCHVEGTAMQLIATEDEARRIGEFVGREPLLSAGRKLHEIPFGAVKPAPCPFLKDESCSIYEVRPEVCRRFQCDGNEAFTKSNESVVSLQELAKSVLKNQSDVADLRNWFPESIDEAMSRHERIAFQFSGGKDSTALLLSMRQYWDRMTVYHLDTGDVHPETKEVVAMLAAMLPHFKLVQSNVFAVKAEFGLPVDLLPWTSSAMAHGCNTGTTPLMQDRVACCYRTTMLPMHMKMIEDGITLVIRGQKNRDHLKGALQSGDVVDGIEFLYPFSDMTDEDCFDIMRENNVPIPRFYNEGLAHSGDCMGCTAWNTEETRAEYLRKYHPVKFTQYRRDMLTIADAVEKVVAGVFRAADACLDGE